MSTAALPQAITLADLLEQLGDISPQRVRLRPPPGTATEADLLFRHGPQCRGYMAYRRSLDSSAVCFFARRARTTRRAIHPPATKASNHGAKNATATPIIRALHINAPAPCPIVRRNVAMIPVSAETRFPWL